jgi:hypothetical protein
MRADSLGATTRTEHAATVAQPTLRPRARLDGVGLVDTELAHIPEVIERASGNGGAPERSEDRVG